MPVTEQESWWVASTDATAYPPLPEALLERNYRLDPADCAPNDICHVLSSPT
jgi:hypothetical protein